MLVFLKTMELNDQKCRICLEENQTERMYELFDVNDNASNSETKKTMSLREKVELCCRVKVRQSSEMPSRICQKCFDMVYYWMHFQNLCWDSQVYLESICFENEFLDKDFEQLYDSLILTNLPNTNKLRPYDDTDDEDSVESFSMEESNIITDGEKVCLALEDTNSKSSDAHKLDTDENVQNKGNTSSEEKGKKTSPPVFMCNKCGNVYDKRSTFHYHMSTHEDVRPHECEACGKKFRQVCELKNHIRRHTGEKPFKCSYCDRNFIDRSEKRRHERTHTNVRPYECKICGKTFAYSAILKNHSKLHSGERAFNCLVCDKAFTLQHQLKAHLNTLVHKQKESQYISAGYEVVYE